MSKNIIASVFIGLGMASACTAEVIKKDGYQFERGSEPAFVSKHAPKAQWPKDFQAETGSYRIWLDDSQVQLGVGEYSDYVYEATNTEALKDAANFSISFAPSWQRLIIHELSTLRAGRWEDRFSADSITLSRRETGFESLSYDGQVSALIVFKDVKPSEPIRVRYSLMGAHPLLKDRVGTRHSLVWSQPILERHIRVVNSLPQTLRYRIYGREREFTLPPNALKITPNEISVALERLEPLRYLDQLPARSAAFPMLQITPTQDWQTVQTTAAAWFAPALAQKNPELDALVTKLKQQSGADQEAYIVAALRLAQDQIRYFAVLFGQSTHKPHLPALVLERAYGDCKDKASLLTALLRANGFDAAPALVNATRQLGIKQDLPDLTSFDHAIVELRFAGKRYWLDPTMSSQGGDLHTQAFPDYGFALPLRESDAAFGLHKMTPIKARINQLETTERFQVDGKGQTILQAKTQWQGEIAEQIRAQFSGMGERKMRENYGSYYTQLFGKQTGTNMLEFRDLRDKNRVDSKESYQFTNMWTPRNGSFYSDFFSQSITSTLKMPALIERQEGLFLRYPYSSEEIVIVELPESGQFFTQNEETVIDDPAFLMRQSFKIKGQTLEVRNTLEMRKTEVQVEKLELHFANRKRALDAASFRIIWKSGDSEAKDANQRSTEQRYRDLLKKLRGGNR